MFLWLALADMCRIGIIVEIDAAMSQIEIEMAMGGWRKP